MEKRDHGVFVGVHVVERLFEVWMTCTCTFQVLIKLTFFDENAPA